MTGVSHGALDLPAKAADAPACHPATDPNAAKKAAAEPTRVAFKLKLKPGMAAEYKKRHDEIRPVLSAAIREAGIRDFSIYHDEETNTFFGVRKLAPDHTAAFVRDTEIMREWWAHKAPLIETNPDQSPVRIPLKEMFHQD